MTAYRLSLSQILESEGRLSTIENRRVTCKLTRHMVPLRRGTPLSGRCMGSRMQRVPGRRALKENGFSMSWMMQFPFVGCGQLKGAAFLACGWLQLNLGGNRQPCLPLGWLDRLFGASGPFKSLVKKPISWTKDK